MAFTLLRIAILTVRRIVTVHPVGLFCCVPFFPFFFGYDAPLPSQNETPPRERSGGTLGADDNFSIACLFREHRAAVAARVVAEDPQTFRGEMCTICWQPIVAEGLGRERGHVYECCRQGVRLGCLRDLQDYGFDRCPDCRERLVFLAGLEGILREPGEPIPVEGVSTPEVVAPLAPGLVRPLC